MEFVSIPDALDEIRVAESLSPSMTKTVKMRLPYRRAGAVGTLRVCGENP